MQKRVPLAVAGLIERHDNHILIALPATPEEKPRRWQFPRGFAQAEESAEAAMRRVAREQLGLGVEIVVGQPPLRQVIDGKEVEMRYFFCGILEGQPRPIQYTELRWVSKGHLREYEFDVPSSEVVEWLLAS